MTTVLRHLFVCSFVLVSACDDDSPSQPPAPDCPARTSGCPCVEGACNDGLACSANVCRTPETTGLRVSDPAARSCEILMYESGARVVEVQFGASVTGKAIRDAERVAITFLANGDTAIPANSVQVVFVGAGSAANLLPIVRASCYDRNGGALPSAGVFF
jgi:hypothetical protein